MSWQMRRKPVGRLHNNNNKCTEEEDLACTYNNTAHQRETQYVHISFSCATLDVLTLMMFIILILSSGLV